MSGKVVVITGASGGIGAALARELTRRGASVVLAARRQPELEAVAAECDGVALPVVADVTERAQVRSVLDTAVERFGHVDVWVNNVGRGITRMPSELTDEDLDDMMRTNVKSALYGMQETLPHFRERGGGHVINVSSMLGRIPFTTQRSAYNGAKHFLNALTANFRAELKETDPGIHVSLVSPGVVFTDFGNHALHGGADSRSFPFGQEPEEVATVIADLIDEPRPDVYTNPGSHDRVVEYYDRMTADP
ncbi:MAG: SDR family NAD(P)-dependent oxidoreductase [Gemmatimonadota bacterium]|jgi:NAD(P)-dependent dehydrogenase (short-subunit alcohol dehydrogenase family)